MKKKKESSGISSYASKIYQPHYLFYYSLPLQKLTFLKDTLIIFSRLNTFTYSSIILAVLCTVLGTEVKRKNKACCLPSRSTRKRGRLQAPGIRETQTGPVSKLGGRAGFQGSPQLASGRKPCRRRRCDLGQKLRMSSKWPCGQWAMGAIKECSSRLCTPPSVVRDGLLSCPHPSLKARMGLDIAITGDYDRNWYTADPR